MKKIALSTIVVLGSSAMVNAQNVGINTDGSVPGMMLHVKVASGDDGIRIQNNSGTGDGLINFQDGTTDVWTMGFDASDANEFKISNSAALATNPRFIIHESTDQIFSGFDGTQAAPAWSFNSDADVGLFRSAADELAFTAGGVEFLVLDEGGTDVAVFNENSADIDFRVESDVNANAFSVNGGTGQIGFFIAQSPFAVIDWEMNDNDGSFPISRFINTNATGTSAIFVGENDAGGGTWVPGVGLGGSSDDAYGVSGYSNTNSAEAFGGYFENDGAFASVGGWEAGPWTMRKIIGNGSVSTIVNTPSGEKVSMTCPEAPEIVFQDFGTGELVNGQAHITIDPILSNNIHVDEDHPLKVYIQLEGDCNGVFVTNKDATGFDVKELASGTSNAKFSWMVVANRANVEVEYSDGTTKVSNNIANRFSPVKDYLPPNHMNPEGVRTMTNYTSKAVNK